jgi:prophage regulatory protein
MANIIRMKPTAAKIGVGLSTVYDWQNPRSPRYDPTFPKRIKLGLATSGIIEADLDAWINLKAKA